MAAVNRNRRGQQQKQIQKDSARKGAKRSAEVTEKKPNIPPPPPPLLPLPLHSHSTPSPLPLFGEDTLDTQPHARDGSVPQRTVCSPASSDRQQLQAERKAVDQDEDHAAKDLSNWSVQRVRSTQSFFDR